MSKVSKLQARVDELEAQLRPISTDERIPDDTRPVLILDVWGVVSIGNYDERNEWWTDMPINNWYLSLDSVTYWMEIPKTLRKVTIETINEFLREE